MRQVIIVVLVLALVAGIGYWFLMYDSAEEVTEDGTRTVSEETERATTSAADEYVSLPEAEAEALAAENGVPFRVVERDGEMLPTTRDFREGRINAVVEGGVVTSYTEELQTPPESDSDASGGAADTADDPVVDVDVEGGVHDTIIGMTEAEAEAYAEAKGVPFRIGSVDGEPQPVTMDYRPGRITASIDGGVVVDYSVE